MVAIPRVSWEDIGGLDEVKQRLIETVDWPLSNPEGFIRLGVTPPRGIVLYGPPGSGKTLVAKAIATQSEANFIAIKGPEVMSKWVGDSEKKVREIFRKAKQVSPCIIFIDELDSITPTRGTGSDSKVSDRVVDQFLTSMDGLENLEGVVVIAATNRPEIVDPALLRPGRFDRLILLPAPSLEERNAILKIHTRDMPCPNVDLNEMASNTEGYVGADLAALVREAAILALRDDNSATEVTSNHFYKALDLVPPSINEDTIKYYSELHSNLAKRVNKGKKRSEDDLYA